MVYAPGLGTLELGAPRLGATRLDSPRQGALRLGWGPGAYGAMGWVRGNYLLAILNSYENCLLLRSLSELLLGALKKFYQLPIQNQLYNVHSTKSSNFPQVCMKPFLKNFCSLTNVGHALKINLKTMQIIVVW